MRHRVAHRKLGRVTEHRIAMLRNQATALLKGDDAPRAIPVIALTALAMKGDEERIRAAGCDGYIAKPMRYQEFLATIAARLAQT